MDVIKFSTRSCEVLAVHNLKALPANRTKFYRSAREQSKEKKQKRTKEKKGSIRFILGKPGENYSYRCMLLRD